MWSRPLAIAYPDVFTDTGKHYVTIWMRGDPDGDEAVIGDTDEIADVGWFDPAALPTPLFLFFENLLAGNCLPPAPPSMPFVPMRALKSSMKIEGRKQ